MIATATTAAEIGERVLKLIDSIHGVDDIAPTHIEKITGMKVDFNPDDRNEYGFGGKLTDVWSYNLLTLTESGGGQPNRLMFSFDDQSHADADMAPICALDFDDYSKALTAAGFASSPAPGEHGSVLYWDFARGGVSVNVYVRAESAAKPKHSCVSSIVINA